MSAHLDLSPKPPTLDEQVVWLYRKSRRAFLGGLPGLATELYAKIRRDHGCELYFEVELPAIFRLIHPLGTVLGRASYVDHLVVYQNCSVGSDVDGGRPTFLGPCVLFPGARIIGSVTLGSNVWVTAGTIIEARPGEHLSVPDNSVVFMSPFIGLSKSTRGSGYVSHVRASWKPTKRSVVERFFPSDSEREIGT